MRIPIIKARSFSSSKQNPTKGLYFNETNRKKIVKRVKICAYLHQINHLPNFQRAPSQAIDSYPGSVASYDKHRNTVQYFPHERNTNLNEQFHLPDFLHRDIAVLLNGLLIGYREQAPDRLQSNSGAHQLVGREHLVEQVAHRLLLRAAPQQEDDPERNNNFNRCLHYKSFADHLLHDAISIIIWLQ